MNPGVAACLLSIVIFIWRIPVADSVKSFVGYMGKCGDTHVHDAYRRIHRPDRYKELLRDAKNIWSAGDQASGAAHCSSIDSTEFGAAQGAGRYFFIFMLGMPVASIVVPLAAEYEADEICCTRGTVLSTLLSIITIPIVSLFM